MRLQLMVLAAVCTGAFADCLPVTSDRIMGRDLALADPQFAALPASLVVGFSPTPGSRRVFASAELARIARANGIAAPNPVESCFEIPMHPLTVDLATTAMRISLPVDAKLNIVELPKAEVPLGEVEFLLTGLEPLAAGVQLWHGNVRYSSTRKVPVWARVAISQKIEAVVTGRDLLPNVPIGAASLRVETWAGPLVRERVAVRMGDVLGRVPKRALKAGSLIPLTLLDDAPVVRRGDAVRVEVNSGPAHLRFNAVAEKEARDGDLVELRNPATGKTFHARLEGSKAVIVIGTGLGL